MLEVRYQCDMYDHIDVVRGPAHVRFDRGERPFWWATGLKKVATVFRKKEGGKKVHYF